MLAAFIHSIRAERQYTYAYAGKTPPQTQARPIIQHRYCVDIAYI